MSATPNQAAEALKQAIIAELHTSRREIIDANAALLVEQNVEIKNILAMLMDIRKAIDATPKAKKAAAATPAADAPAEGAGTAPAAKPKGSKKDNYASWFKNTYEVDEALRARIDAMPAVAATIAGLADELKRKKSDKARYTARANAILANHPALAQAEHAKHNVTPLVAEGSPRQ